jgi:[protein-PII] uridylyltransferase
VAAAVCDSDWPRAGNRAARDACAGCAGADLPEFHGIDALVIRDAYHRYTVDEHTFVLIDTLHGLEAETGPQGSRVGA